MVFLDSHGVGTARAVRIFNTDGADVAQGMTDEPHRLARPEVRRRLGAMPHLLATSQRRSSLATHKTDRNDARGLAHPARMASSSPCT